MIHGYNDPGPGATCLIGTPPDHCQNQQFGLDIRPADQTLEILAPASGTLSWIDDKTHADGSPPSRCLGMTVDGLNVSICHFGSYKGVVKTGDKFHQGQFVERGCILGLRDTSWIHISLDDRRVAPHVPVAFTGANAIEGVGYPAKDLSIADQYGPTDSTQLAGAATITSRNAPRDCSAGSVPPPMPATYSADFSAWPLSGGWNRIGAMLVNDGSGGTILSPYQPTGIDYSVEAEIQIVKLVNAGAITGRDDAGVVVRADPNGGGFLAGYCAAALVIVPCGDASQMFAIYTVDSQPVGKGTATTGDTAWHTYRVTVRADTISLSVDGKLAEQDTDNRYLQNEQVGLWSRGIQLYVRAFRVASP